MTVTATLPERRSRYGLPDVLRSEFTKLRTLRSTGWTLLVTVVGTIGITVLVTNGAAHHNRGWYAGGFDPTQQSLAGLLLAFLSLGVLGVLAASGEYATGTIRSSLAATPRRPLFLLGKVLVVGALALVVGEVLSFVAFGVGQAVLSSGGVAPTASLAQAGVLRAVLLSGAVLSLVTLSALALGVIFRHTAGALSMFLGLTFLLPLIMSRISNDSTKYTPIPILTNSLSAVVPNGDHLTAPQGFGLMALYTVVLLGLATAVLLRRDA